MRFRPRLYHPPTSIPLNQLVHLLDAQEVGHRSLRWGFRRSVLVVHDQLRGQEAQPLDLGHKGNPTSDMEDRKADGHYIIARSFFASHSFFCLYHIKNLIHNTIWNFSWRYIYYVPRNLISSNFLQDFFIRQ